MTGFDVFVLTSAYEGSPNALLEAMAAGLPSVATDVEGTRDVFEESGETDRSDAGELGILTRADDPADMAAVLARLITDRTRMRDMGERASRYVLNHYSLRAMIEGHSQVFREVLGTMGPAR